MRENLKEGNKKEDMKMLQSPVFMVLTQTLVIFLNFSRKKKNFSWGHTQTAKVS